MAGPPRPSFPSAPSEPSLRRLGVGGSGGGGDRPLRAQLVVALVAVLILLAVPLYLWRRPQPATGEALSASAPAAMSAPPIVAPTPGDAASDRVKLAKLQKVKCSAAPSSSGQEGALCDALPFFEQALAKAIRDTVDCAPEVDKTGTINYVLTIDFTSRKVHVFPGASGSWKGPQAKRAALCVKRALPAPPWDTIQHQYRYYMVAIMASYEPPPPSSTPMFE